MAVDDATLVFGLKDEVSGGINRILVALEKYNTATKRSDKNTVTLEKSLANVQAKMEGQVAGTNAAAAGYTKAATAAAGYEASLKRIAGINVTKNGALQGPNGQFISQQSAQFEQALKKAKALQAAQAGLGISNGAFLDPNGVARTVKGAQATSTALSDVIDHAVATRYALFSVSQTLALVGAGLVAIPVASAILAANYERDFATVERATLIAGKQAAALKSSLIDLSETVPVSFKNITQIAAAGAQLGIAPSGLVNFTRVVAELTATTNLSAEAAENFLGKFAKIAGVPQSQFVNLASSILNVGVHTAATESQIAKLSTQLVGIGREAGFTVPQLIGLAGALASVSSVGPELARGTVTRFVTDIQRAVESGGPALEAFAKTAGVTANDVQKAFGTDQFAGVFQKFINGLDQIQESGGNANAVLATIGITSVRDVPLLLNLAAGHKTLAEAIKLANEGFQNQDILAQHYAKINDTLVSKVKELGNTFAAFLNSIGSASTGPLKELVDQIGVAVKGLSEFAKTDFGQNTLIFAAAAFVLVGALALIGSALAKIVGGALAAVTVYNNLTKTVQKFQVAQEAAAAASATGQTKFASFASFLGNPYVIAVLAAVAVLAILSDQLEKTKSTAAEVQNALATGQGFDKLSNVITKGNAGGNLFAGLAGADVAAKFKDFNNSVAKAAHLTGGNLWDQIIAGFGQGTLSEAQSMQLFEDRLKDVGTQLGTLAQSDLPGAQNGFALLAGKTDGTKKQLVNLLNAMPAYKEELSRQLTVAHQAVTTSNLLKLAYGGIGDGALNTAGKAKVLTDEIDRQRQFQAQLLEVSGLQQKDVDDYGAAYQKSIQPLTDFNSIVSQVQDNLNKNAKALSDKTGKDVSKFYDGVSVSLAQFTKQLEDNNAKQATWFQNVVTVATLYGQDAATIFIQAGYSAVNNSILQQLVDATPAQAQAYIDAQTTAAETAAAATGEALISAGHLMTAAGGQVGKDTATQIGKELLAGFSPADIMKQFNLVFTNNPGVPKVDTGPANAQLQDFILRNSGQPLVMPLYLNVSPANNQLANYRGKIANNVFAEGGYTGGGSKFQPAGIVHAGEFVFTKEATSRIGVDKLYSLMRDSRGASSASRVGGYSSGGAVGGGFATLDAQTMAAIVALAQRPIYLYTSDKLIAESASRGNVQIAYGGQN